MVTYLLADFTLFKFVVYSQCDELIKMTMMCGSAPLTTLDDLITACCTRDPLHSFDSATIIMNMSIQLPVVQAFINVAMYNVK